MVRPTWSSSPPPRAPSRRSRRATCAWSSVSPCDPSPPVASWTVERSKVADYLLNDAHPDGASKAKYLTAFGFTRSRADRLAAALAEHAVACGPGREVRPPIGLPRLVIEGPLAAPDGRSANVRTVWELVGDAEARLVTLVPLTR